MSVVMWVLVAVLAGLLAGFVMQRGSYGRGWDVTLGLIGSIVVSWIFQSQWVAPDPGLVAVTIVAAGGRRVCSSPSARSFLHVPRAHHMDRCIPARRAGVRPTSRS